MKKLALFTQFARLKLVSKKEAIINNAEFAKELEIK